MIGTNNIPSKGESICWICDGWQQIKFEWTSGKSGDINCEPLYIHLDFEDY